jgi:hypothetical protein
VPASRLENTPLSSRDFFCARDPLAARLHNLFRIAAKRHFSSYVIDY